LECRHGRTLGWDSVYHKPTESTEERSISYVQVETRVSWRLNTHNSCGQNPGKGADMGVPITRTCAGRCRYGIGRLNNLDNTRTLLGVRVTTDVNRRVVVGVDGSSNPSATGIGDTKLLGYGLEKPLSRGNGYVGHSGERRKGDGGV